jgi:hypothetical protein
LGVAGVQRYFINPPLPKNTSLIFFFNKIHIYRFKKSKKENIAIINTVRFPLDAATQIENPFATDPLNEEIPLVTVEEEEEN